MKSILIFAALLLTVSSCTKDSDGAWSEGSPVYYIDATAGDDSRTGTSEGEAWKTFAPVNARILPAGTQVLLKKGEVWHERLEIKGTGKPDRWITVGAYGDRPEKPRIQLSNGEDDIAVLVTDLYRFEGNTRAIPMNYIQIDGLEIADSRMGIYYRTVMKTKNTGLKISNVTFTNIQCDDLTRYINAAPENLGDALAAPKGNLAGAAGGNSGGAYEYVFPAAIMIGGRIGQHSVSGDHYTVLTEFEVSGCTFDDAFTGIMGWFYWPLAPGNPEEVWRELIHKVRITDCRGTGFLNGIIAFDGVNGNAVTDADGISSPDEDGWGVIQNVLAEEGAVLPHRTLLNGTTAVIINNTQNFLFDRCEFSKMTHHGNPDGCGFDFESHNSRITLRNSKFVANRGESILLMNGGNYGGNSGIRICNNLFVDNLKGTGQFHYELAFSLPTDGHSDVRVYDNTFFMNKENEAGEKITLYDQTLPYVTSTNNRLYYLDENGAEVTGSFWDVPYSYRAVPAN